MDTSERDTVRPTTPQVDDLVQEFFIAPYSGLLKTHTFADGRRVVLEPMLAVQEKQGYVIRLERHSNRVHLLPVLLP